jgi:hypothetical protein
MGCNMYVNFNIGYLSFIRLIGTIYFKKHNTAFSTTTPETHFNSFQTLSVKEQHLNWLNDIRQTIWPRTKFEDEMMPSNDALYFHWKRTCWVRDMWKQADANEMEVKALSDYGWQINEGVIGVMWDSAENIKKIRKRAEILLKGCKCKTGCSTGRCRCRKDNSLCTEGCDCLNCENDSPHTTEITDDYSESDTDEFDFVTI